MKKIVFFSIPLFGHVNYGLKIARKLNECGYKTEYYSGKAYEKFIKESGVSFRSYSEEIENLFSEKDSSYNNEYMQYVRAEKLNPISEWYKFCYHLYNITDIFFRVDIKKMQKPDLVIYDSAALWGRYVSKYWNCLSVASCTPYTYPEEYAKEDLVRFSKLIFQKNYDSLMIKRIIQILNYNLDSEFKNVSPCSIFEPLSPRADYKIIYSVKEFQSGARYLNQDNTLFSGIIYDELTCQKDFSDILSDDVPNIYIAFGSIYNNASVFSQIYDSCKFLNYNFIMNIGETIDPKCFDYFSSNWKVVSHIEQIELLKKVDLFISHGGVNSVREAMTFGVPIIVLPTEGDTLCTAEDIRMGNYGFVLNIYDINKIGKLTEELIENAEIKENCKKISKIMKNSSGLNGIINFIDHIIKM